MMISKVIVVLLIYRIRFTNGWNFTIARNSTNMLAAGVVDSIDQFNISECIDSDNLCTKFGGQRLQDKCQCVCSQDKSTFGFYNNEWKCTKNSIVRQHAASATCRYRLQRPSNSKGDDDPLFTLPVLGPGGDNNYVRYLPVNKTCTIVAANATFLKCNGTWGQLTESKVNNKLTFQTKLPGTVYVGPYKAGSSVDPSVDGRVIRIPMECEDLTWTPSQCVTIKIKGKLTCSIKDAPGINTTKDPTRTPSPTTIDIKTIKKPKDDPTSATAVIAGSVAGGVVFVMLIAVIIILVICLKREKAKVKKKRGPTDGNQEPGTERETEPDYQYPSLGMVTNSDTREPGTEREIEPDYQYPRAGMVTSPDNRELGTQREAVSDYQYPRVGMVTSPASIHGQSHPNQPDYQNMRDQASNPDIRPVANRDDSTYESMNADYQNIGNKEQDGHPYVNVC